MTEQIHTSERFTPPKSRRDVLGLAAAWSAIVAFVVGAVGALRLPMPSVFPESNSRVKLGPPSRFAPGTRTYFPKHRLWLFADPDGFHAISSVCTHLGCIVDRGEDGRFSCPCHGSRFDERGRVTAGPAPKGLAWLELSISPEGALVADTLKEVKRDTLLSA